MSAFASTSCGYRGESANVIDRSRFKVLPVLACPRSRQDRPQLPPPLNLLRQLAEDLHKLPSKSGVMRLRPRIVQRLRQNISDRDQTRPLPSDAIKPVDLFPHSLDDRARLHRRAFVDWQWVGHRPYPLLSPMPALILPIVFPAHVATAPPPVTGPPMRRLRRRHVVTQPFLAKRADTAASTRMASRPDCRGEPRVSTPNAGTELVKVVRQYRETTQLLFALGEGSLKDSVPDRQLLDRQMRDIQERLTDLEGRMRELHRTFDVTEEPR